MTTRSAGARVDGPNIVATPPSLASELLAAEVKRRVRERGLVVWVDADAQYSGLVDRLAGGDFGFSYPVVPFRGSYLELMLALEPYGNGLHPDHVLVHLPGLNKDSVAETPAFELFKAGKVFEKNLAALVREAAVGIATPEEIDAFVRGEGLALAEADRWLDDLRAQPRDHLTVLLEGLGLDDVVVGLVTGDRRLTGHLPAAGRELLAFLEKGLGLDAAWRAFRIGDAELTPSAMAALVGGWIMAVEFVTDLGEPPATPELRPLAKLGPFAKECRRLAARLREQHADAYEQIASELQDHLALERTSHHASALGSIDTFRFEEATIRAAALSALRRGDWRAAESYAARRTIEHSFWVRRSPTLRRSWEIIRHAATCGARLAETAKALERAASLEEAVARYATDLAPVDRAHRVFEQRAHALLASDLDDYDALLDVRVEVRKAYRAWADTQARAFFELCKRHGALPGRELRQRSIYEDVVHPLVEQGGGVALFMVDALRFEMAQALEAELRREKYRTKLTARLAELPTITAVGMNALAPVERDGRLRAVTRNGGIEGWSYASGFAICEPPDRIRAMSTRSLASGRVEDFELAAFHEMSLTQLKRRLSARPALVVVRSRELDTAGEHGLHLGTFDDTLALLKSAISLLAQAGVERFVIVSDHGFLLQDTVTTENVPFGASMRVAERRHALLDRPSGMPDVLEVRLSSLDYEVAEDGYLVFRPDTALWRTKEKIPPFVHGGNSPQERVIPVLEVDRTVARGKTTSKYEVVARAEPAELGRQRLRVSIRLQDRQSGTLGFLAPKAIDLALRVPERSDIAVRLIKAEPPAELAEGRVLVPPNRDEALVEFELEGFDEDRVRVEVFHPGATEEVTPKVVEGFFDVARNRRVRKAKSGLTSAPPPPPAADPARDPSAPPARGDEAAVPAASAPAASAPAVSAPAASAPAAKAPASSRAHEWADLVADEGFRRVLSILAERRTINELELQQILGSARRVRSFSRHFDELVLRLPFEVEIRTVNGLKAYVRKD